MTSLQFKEEDFLYTHKQVKIHLDSAYKWGRGWNESEAAEFKDTLYPKFIAAGYYIQPDEFKCCAETLLSEADPKFRMYLHPLEFSGFATDGQLAELEKILKDSPSVVHGVSIKYMPAVYEMSDEEYKKILEDNRGSIIEWAKNFLKKHGERAKYEIQDEFVKAFRIPRVREGEMSRMSFICYTQDVDCLFLDSLLKEVQAG